MPPRERPGQPGGGQREAATPQALVGTPAAVAIGIPAVEAVGYPVSPPALPTPQAPATAHAVAACAPPLSQQQPPQQQRAAPDTDLLQALIQRAEALRLDLQRSSGSSSLRQPLPPAPPACEQRLAPARGGVGSPATGTPAPADSDLSAATAALVHAARALQARAAAVLLPLAAQPPLALLPAAVSAAPPRAAAGELDSDAESEAEDALLEALFFPPRSAEGGWLAGEGSPAAGAARGASSDVDASSPPAVPDLVLHVHLGALWVEGGLGGSARCVVRPVQPGCDAPQTLWVAATAGPEAADAAAAHDARPRPATVVLAVAPPHLAPFPHQLVLEFWAPPAGSGSGRLLGVARVPLRAAEAGSTAHSGAAAVLAEGRHPVVDLLGGGHPAGSLEVWAVLQRRGEEAALPALRHTFTVRVGAACRLPSAAAYAAAELQAPDARRCRYTFPGWSRGSNAAWPVEAAWPLSAGRRVINHLSNRSPSPHTTPQASLTPC